MISDDKLQEIRDNASITDLLKREKIKLTGKDGAWCCCPFHQEKTASLHVDTDRNIWHCFGCGKGGDVFTFAMEKNNMSFYEAVRYVADVCKIDLEETEPNPEQSAKSQKREALLTAIRICDQYFRSSLIADNEEAAEARKYLYDRWGKDFVLSRGIGYAPNTWEGLVQFAGQNSLSDELLAELGVIVKRSNGSGFYDQFRGRIMIPIYLPTGQLVGYTARILPKFKDETTKDGRKPPKYINSSNSTIYPKGKTLFGLDYACKASKKANMVYLVEGAGDVLRLETLGVNNAVACLGSDWTEAQLTLLRRYTSHLTFIPDSDEPTDDNKLGTGVSKVIKHGEAAIKLGFTVHVKEIGLKKKKVGKDESRKQDADSYFTTLKCFEELEEQNFIAWYANKLHNNFPNQDMEHIKLLADLLCYLESDEERAFYKDSINKVFRKKDALNEALSKALKQHTEKILAGDNASVTYEEFGFSEKDNCYCGYLNGSIHEWSNFVLKPLFHVRDSISALRLFRITNKHGQSQYVEFKQEELVGLDKFKNKVESLGNFVWLARMEQLTKLKLYLYRTTESADQIKQLGWHRKGFFAYGNGIMYNGRWLPVDNLGIVRIPKLGNYYLPAFSEMYATDYSNFKFERQFVHLNNGRISFYDYNETFVSVFGDKAIVAICFLLASLFQDIVRSTCRFFPILNLFGPKSTGKTAFGQAITTFFVIDYVAPNLVNSTLSALSDTVAAVSNAVIQIDEYKNIIETEKREFVKGLWDGAGRTRMNMDRDKKAESTHVQCGVVLTGQEMCTADIAMFSRVIFVGFYQDKFSADEKKRMAKLKHLQSLGCSHLTMELLKLRPQVEASFHDSYNEVSTMLADEFQEKVEERIIGNWAVLLAMFHTMQQYIEFPFDFNKVYFVVREGIVNQNAQSRSSSELADFWDVFQNLIRDKDIFNEVDFFIEEEDSILVHLDGRSVVRPFTEPTNVLYLRFSPVFHKYKLHCTNIGEKTLPMSSLELYMKHAPEFMGIKKSFRFREEPSSPTREKVTNAMAFNYDQLDEAYNLGLLNPDRLEKKDPKPETMETNDSNPEPESDS